jgi:thiol-disulfide isomerase/thioredoxin
MVVLSVVVNLCPKPFMKKSLYSILLTGFVLGLATFCAPAAADLGDPAAKLNIAEWVKGQPVTVGNGSNIFVVEFWATWCPPCRASIPHLSKLQKEFKDKGVIFVGVSTEKLTVVKPFVEKMGAEMDYTVAVDNEGKTSEGYMEAFNINGIPHAFVVDKKARVIWQGHPMDGLDKVLPQIVAGTYDLEKARKRMAGEKLLGEFFEAAQKKTPDEAKLKDLAAKIEVLDKEAGGLLPEGKKFDAVALRKEIRFESLTEQYAEAFGTGEAEDKLAALAKQLQENAPADFKLDEFKSELTIQKLFKDYYGAVSRQANKEKAATLAKQIREAGCKNPMLLNEMAWAILTDKEVKDRDLSLAVKLAKDGVDASEGKDASILDTYAKALFDSGKVAEAIVQQKKAVEKCDAADRKSLFEKTLREYEAKAK